MTGQTRRLFKNGPVKEWVSKMMGNVVKSIISIAAMAGFLLITGVSHTMAQSPQNIRPAMRAAGAIFAGDLVVPLNKSQIIEMDQSFKRISVGNPEIADVLPLTNRTLYVLGKQFGVTNITVFDKREKPIAVVDVTVSYDVQGLKTRLNELFPEDTIEVRAANDALVLSGTVSGAERLSQVTRIAESFAAGKVRNLMRVKGSQQVLLQVRFAEVSRELSRQFGFRTNVIGSDFAFSTFTFTDLVSAFTIPGATFGAAEAIISTGSATIDTLIEALETKGVLKTLAEPNLMALSGETANFLAGGEFPVPVAQSTDEDSTVITVEFKEFGVSLAFTPTVIDGDTINIAVAPEVSAVDFVTAPVLAQGFEIPGLTTRRVETTVELRDGQSFAIAGLFQSDFADNVDQLPWAGDVPILGALFRSSQFQKDETELVVIVTPYLVQPSRPQDLALPTDRFVEPTDFDIFFAGRAEGSALSVLGLNRSAPRSGQETSAGFAGSYGHIIE